MPIDKLIENAKVILGIEDCEVSGKKKSLKSLLKKLQMRKKLKYYKL